MAEAKGVEAVDRALRILDAFSPAAPVRSLTEIARETGFHKSTILRLAVSLERYGHLVRRADGQFRLGPTTWHLGAAYRQSFDLGEVLRPELKYLSDATNETASFYIREGNSRICLYRSEPPRSIRHSILEGTIMPLAQGASGHVLCAWEGDEDTSEVRKAGHAVSHGERDPEVAAIAVPLFTTSGRLVGALSISGLITRFKPEGLSQFLSALKESQGRLAKIISH